MVEDERTITIAVAEYERLLAEAADHGPSDTIDSFCQGEKISRALYYKMKVEGWAPAEMWVGDSVRITPRARREWRRQRERAAAAGVRRKFEAA
jgi:hypothetical protein